MAPKITLKSLKEAHPELASMGKFYNSPAGIRFDAKDSASDEILDKADDVIRGLMTDVQREVYDIAPETDELWMVGTFSRTPAGIRYKPKTIASKKQIEFAEAVVCRLMPEWQRELRAVSTDVDSLWESGAFEKTSSGVVYIPNPIPDDLDEFDIPFAETERKRVTRLANNFIKLMGKEEVAPSGRPRRAATQRARAVIMTFAEESDVSESEDEVEEVDDEHENDDGKDDAGFNQAGGDRADGYNADEVQDEDSDFELSGSDSESDDDDADDTAAEIVNEEEIVSESEEEPSDDEIVDLAHLSDQEEDDEEDDDIREGSSSDNAISLSDSEDDGEDYEEDEGEDADSDDDDGAYADSEDE